MPRSGGPGKAGPAGAGPGGWPPCRLVEGLRPRGVAVPGRGAQSRRGQSRRAGGQGRRLRGDGRDRRAAAGRRGCSRSAGASRGRSPTPAGASPTSATAAEAAVGRRRGRRRGAAAGGNRTTTPPGRARPRPRPRREPPGGYSRARRRRPVEATCWRLSSWAASTSAPWSDSRVGAAAVVGRQGLDQPLVLEPGQRPVQGARAQGHAREPLDVLGHGVAVLGAVGQARHHQQRRVGEPMVTEVAERHAPLPHGNDRPSVRPAPTPVKASLFGPRAWRSIWPKRPPSTSPGEVGRCEDQKTAGAARAHHGGAAADRLGARRARQAGRRAQAPSRAPASGCARGSDFPTASAAAPPLPAPSLPPVAPPTQFGPAPRAGGQSEEHEDRTAHRLGTGGVAPAGRGGGAGRRGGAVRLRPGQGDRRRWPSPWSC